MRTSTAPSAYSERMRVPWTWWIVVGLIVILGIFEVGAGFNWEVLTVVACFLVGFFVLPLVLSGRARVQVDGGELRVAGESLPVTALTSVQALDREETRRRLGTAADPAARLVTRGWIPTSVMVRLQNPHPVPYWLISTRHPDELVAAISTERQIVRGERPRPPRRIISTG